MAGVTGSSAAAAAAASRDVITLDLELEPDQAAKVGFIYFVRLSCS
jgi:hypothetical protein